VGKNKNNKPIVAQQSEDIFDVKKNLRKLRQSKSSYNSSNTETDNALPKYSQPLSSANQLSGFSDSYGTSFTESVYNRYDKLKDDLRTEVGSLKDEISSQGTGIRQELNDKFHELSKDKVSTTLFWQVIGGLVGFATILVGIIYTLSYSSLVSDVKDNSDSIRVQNVRNENVDKKLKDISTEIKLIKKKN
jgi:hypothetical protein